MKAIGKAYSYPTLILWERMQDNGHRPEMTPLQLLQDREREREAAGRMEAIGESDTATDLFLVHNAILALPGGGCSRKKGDGRPCRQPLLKRCLATVSTGSWSASPSVALQISVFWV